MNCRLEDFEYYSEEEMMDTLLTEASYRTYQNLKSAKGHDLVELVDVTIDLVKELRKRAREVG